MPESRIPKTPSRIIRQPIAIPHQIKGLISPVVHKPKTQPLKIHSKRQIQSPQPLTPHQIPVVRQQPISKDKPRNLPVDIVKIANIKNRSKGRILIIVANGPSRLEADLPKLLYIPSIDIMTVNKPDKRVWPTSHWIFSDLSQFRRYRTEWETYTGIIFNTPSINQVRPNTIVIKNIGGNSFSLDLQKGFGLGRSTTYAAMQVGNYMGYDKIYVFGCDMTSVGGKVYEDGRNPDVDDETRLKRFALEATSYQKAADTLPKDIKDKFVFCSSYNPWPFMDKFNKLNQKEAVDVILKESKGA